MTGWRFDFLGAVGSQLAAWLDWLLSLFGRGLLMKGPSSGPWLPRQRESHRGARPSRGQKAKPPGGPGLEGGDKSYGDPASEERSGSETRSLESAAKEEAAPAGGAPAPRFVNTWFEGEDPVLPLLAGRRYPFHVQIGPRRVEAGALPMLFVEPDWGDRREVCLVLTLYSRDFAIEVGHHKFWLPRQEPSPELISHLTPLRAGPCRLRLVVSLACELEVLQELEVEVEAVEAPAAVPAGA